MMPAYAFERMAGKTASPINPNADNTSDAMTLFLYPILSTNLAQKRSVTSCVKKKTDEMIAICPNGIPK